MSVFCFICTDLWFWDLFILFISCSSSLLISLLCNFYCINIPELIYQFHGLWACELFPVFTCCKYCWYKHSCMCFRLKYMHFCWLYLEVEFLGCRVSMTYCWQTVKHFCKVVNAIYTSISCVGEFQWLHISPSQYFHVFLFFASLTGMYRISLWFSFVFS